MSTCSFSPILECVPTVTFFRESGGRDGLEERVGEKGAGRGGRGGGGGGDQRGEVAACD